MLQNVLENGYFKGVVCTKLLPSNYDLLCYICVTIKVV